MNIVYDEEDITKKACLHLTEMIKNHGEVPLLLLLSGGSALKILEGVSEEVFAGNNLTVGMVDDRFTRDVRASNFMQVRATRFYLHGLRRGAVFIDSSVGEFETLETFAKRYETELKKWKKANPTGIIRIVLGMGVDGHTAGILPHPEDPKKLDILFNGPGIVVGYDAGIKNEHRFRMTSTFTLLKQSEQTLVYVTEEEKRGALEKIQAEKGSLAETPARIIKDLKNVTLFTDINYDILDTH
jgi:6-phosphogluconolactonase/glucosamine-6-phosphate isomerase/deaminase